MICTNHDNMLLLFIYKLALCFIYEQIINSFMSSFYKYQDTEVFTDHDPFIMLLVLKCDTEYSMFGKKCGIQEIIKLLTDLHR